MLEKRTQLAVEIEAVEGTAETLLAADAILVANPKFTPDTKMNARNHVSTSLSPYAAVPGARSAQIEFDVALIGSGTAGTPPPFADLLKGAGFAETIVAGTSVTYLPASSAVPSLTAALYEDDTIISKIWGARANVKIALVTGDICWLHFVLTGADFSVSAGSFLSGVSYPSVVPAAFLNANFTLASYAALIGKLDIDMGNKVELRPSANASSGYISAKIVDRMAMLSLDPEKVAVATHDFYGLLRAGTEGALTATLGATAGNICTITAPKVQYTSISEQARGQLRTLGIDCQLNRSSGDDELSLAFT
ncbi:MAG: hypothetical protein ABIL58_19965 [Pseudomonadota bacterium]